MDGRLPCIAHFFLTCFEETPAVAVHMVVRAAVGGFPQVWPKCFNAVPDSLSNLRGFALLGRYRCHMWAVARML
eukprot:4988774-Prymnesium_polylepis.1